MALLLLLLVVASSLTTLTSSIADILWKFCDTDGGTFDNNSTYSSNFNFTLSNISSRNFSASGFAISTVGKDDNSVYSLVLCRGDIDASECFNCRYIAASNTQNNCTNYKATVVWYDNCQLRFSNKNFLIAPDISSNIQYMMINYDMISDDQLQQFETQAIALLNRMIDFALRNSSHYFATGETPLNKSDVVYALVQCAQDLSDLDCRLCLQEEVDQITNKDGYISGSRGGRLLGKWCNLRYEFYKFYVGTSLVQPQLPSSKPPASEPSSPNTNTRSPASEPSSPKSPRDQESYRDLGAGPSARRS